jgi:hypothetical protein
MLVYEYLSYKIGQTTIGLKVIKIFKLRKFTVG